MNKIIFRAITVATTLVLSGSLNAAIITHGNLISDDTTDFITDSITNRQYMRFDTFDLSYTETLAAVNVGGIYEGWSIADSTIADDFFRAALAPKANACDGAVSFGTSCGIMSSWNNGDFGDSYDAVEDYFWYISSYETPFRNAFDLGIAHIDLDGRIREKDDWRSFTSADTFTVANGNSINALLFREAMVVPVPAAVWLFGSGLLGLAAIARRKKQV